MTEVKKIIVLGFILINHLTFAQTNLKPNGSGYYKKLVWSDEFNYEGLPDSSKWNYETGYLRNHELQYYTSYRKENAEVKNGNLIIRVKNDSLKINGKIYPITSADITSNKKQEWKYGRFEIRAKIPSSLGTWPAIWMLGSSIDKMGWPACGEIDIMEHVGYMPDTLHFNVHTKKYNHVIKTNKGSKIQYSSPNNDFHIFALEWFQDHIDWYFDNKKVFSFKNEGTGNDAWPFDKPEYLMINFAFGGDWGGSRGVDIKSLPQEFFIDYVRVYQ